MVSQQGATGSHTALCDHVHCPVCGTMQEAPCVTHLHTTMSHMRASHTCSSTLEWKCSLAVVCIKCRTVAACAPCLSHRVVPLQSLCHTQRCLCKCSPGANVGAGSFTVSAFKTKASTQCPPEDVNNPDPCSCSPALADVARIPPRATGMMIVGPVT